jgi:hypothetical protein
MIEPKLIDLIDSEISSGEKNQFAEKATSLQPDSSLTESVVEKIFKERSHCRLADIQDEPELLRFMNMQPMQTKNWSLSFQRGQDYFSFYRLSGGSFFPFVMTNSQGSICGSSGLIRISTSVRGEPSLLGYLCDLRVDPRAPAKRKSDWRSIYLDLITQLRTTQNPKERCDYFVTSVFDTNLRALQVLTRKLTGIQYLPLQKYNARSLLFHPWPGFYNRLDHHLLAKTNRKIDRGYLEDWQKMNAGSLGLPYLPDQMAIDKYLGHLDNHWRPLNPFPTIEVTDRHGNKLGACWPWLGSSVRAPVVQGLSPFLSRMGGLLPKFGRAPIVNGQPMSQIFLTHLMIHPHLPKEQKHKVLRKLVLETYKLAAEEKVHLITWIEGRWPAAPRANLPDGLIFDMPATMYQVIPTSSLSDSRLLLPHHTPLYLEGASL